MIKLMRYDDVKVPNMNIIGSTMILPMTCDKKVNQFLGRCAGGGGGGWGWDSDIIDD